MDGWEGGTSWRAYDNATCSACLQVRSYKHPLTGEFQEHQCHLGGITKLALSYGDTHLFTASEDGCVFVFDVKDRDDRAAKREKDLHMADETLITRTDLEDMNQQMVELREQVNELTSHNEYQLRLRDLNYQEKIKELTEKFNQELEAARTKYEVCSRSEDAGKRAHAHVYASTGHRFSRKRRMKRRLSTRTS